MMETDSGVPPSSASPYRRRALDLVLAGFICLAAACYWAWDGKNNFWPGDAQPLKAPAQVSKAHFNDDGFRLFSASDYIGAEAQFRKAISANPREAVGFCNLGAALIAQRRFDEAIVALHTAIALDPAFKLARNNLNWALEEKAKSWK